LKKERGYVKSLKSSLLLRAHPEARDTLEVELRPFIQGRLMNNRCVTDDDKIALGLHVRDHKPTPSPDPDDTPTIETKAAVPGVIEVIFGGKNEKGHAKPKDYHGIEVRHLVGDKDHLSNSIPYIGLNGDISLSALTASNFDYDLSTAGSTSARQRLAAPRSIT
jgi:hypothetical protein